MEHRKIFVSKGLSKDGAEIDYLLLLHEEKKLLEQAVEIQRQMVNWFSNFMKNEKARTILNEVCEELKKLDK